MLNSRVTVTLNCQEFTLPHPGLLFKYLYLCDERFIFFIYFLQHCFICRSSDFTVSEDAGIEHMTVGIAVRRSSHWAKYLEGIKHRKIYKLTHSYISFTCIFHENKRTLWSRYCNYQEHSKNTGNFLKYLYYSINEMVHGKLKTFL
jgi:hypothetical protein